MPLLLLLLFPPLIGPSSAESLYKICGTTGNYTGNSTYASNLSHLLSYLSSNASATIGYATNSTGSVPDRIHGIIFCRGDTDAATCHSCLSTAILDIQQLCSNSKDATIWYDFCQLRYSNQDFLYAPDVTSNNKVFIWNTHNISADKLSWFQTLTTAMIGNASDFSVRNAPRLFATAEAERNASRIYGLVQCARVLSDLECRTCLEGMRATISRDPLKGKVGGRVLGLWCHMRYEMYKFYNGKSMLQLSSAPSRRPSPQSVSSDEGSSSLGTVLAITIPIVVVLVLIASICMCFWRRRSKTKIPRDYNSTEIPDLESMLFDLSTLRIATENFSKLNKLGEVGFCSVYKGMLPDGREIAIKKLSRESGQGLQELKNELVLMANLQHRNIVNLYGVCLEEQEKLLVYEYVPNKSLDTILFDPTKSGQLDWGKRYKIIGGIARGLLYLHEESQVKIIHRDLTASNILLDADMNPKISDFGLARLFGADHPQGMTSRIVGTYGYMAPEYVMHGHFSVKSDVFSFGVLLLEIITGRSNNGFFNSERSEDLLSYVSEKWNERTIFEILDPAIARSFPVNEVERCIQIGLLCAQKDPAQRPNMATVAVMLNTYSESLEAPLRPAFSIEKLLLRNFSGDSWIY